MRGLFARIASRLSNRPDSEHAQNLIRMVIGFGKVTKWLAITLGGLLMGTVMLGDAVVKIISWMRGHG
jgi:hypothetical protein